ncbi:MAG: WXG100 family type VII secretion target [Dietzia sp.]
MGYTIGRVRRWDAGGVTTASSAVAERTAVAEGARTTLEVGRSALDEGWDGVAADAVLDAAEGEKLHVTKLANGLEDLSDTLTRAAAALGPALQAVRDRIADAEATGLVVGEDSVGPAPGRDEITQDVVDGHVEALGLALDTVGSLDQHYGREIDAIAEMIHRAIPPGVDRGPIPGPDAAILGTAVTTGTGAVRVGAPNLADELDPETRGRHKLNPVPDDVGRRDARRLRGLGRLAGPVSGGFTVFDGVRGYANGETSAWEATFETGGALGGGMAGGAVAGAAAGSFLGPAGAFVGAGIGAAVGAWAGQEAGGAVHDAFIGDSGPDADDAGPDAEEAQHGN